MKFSELFVFIVLYNNLMSSEGLPKKSKLSEILERIESLPNSLLQVKNVEAPKFDHFESTIMHPFNFWDLTFAAFFTSPYYITKQYERLIEFKEAKGIEENRLMDLHTFANQSTSFLSNNSSNEFIKFKWTLFPNSIHGGIFYRYSNFIEEMSGISEQWCRAQSLNYFMYTSFKYTLNIITKGYSTLLQSLIIRNALENGAFEAKINEVKEDYNSTIDQIVNMSKKITSDASTRIARCDPPNQVRNKTYLEMEKLLQGIVPPEIVLNDGRQIGICSDYENGIESHGDIGGEDNWKCYGKIYDCFELKPVLEICQATNFSRRMDGLIRQITRINSKNESKINYEAIGNVTSCSTENRNLISLSQPRVQFSIRRCACICDDSNHPNTLRRFSKKPVLSNYEKNMVVTGVRLVNISNVIHIEIQQGKLEENGVINLLTVQWKSEDALDPNEIMDLSYNSRRMNLDAFYLEPNEVVIGAAFEMDSPNDGVILTVFYTEFTFSTGELVQDYQRRSGSVELREEIVLEQPHVPTMCSNNIKVDGNAKFVSFQATDWKRDAAQTTVPYLDIQAVVTNPPTMLRGIGLYYKRAAECGGYLGLELYSHEYQDLILDDETSEKPVATTPSADSVDSTDATDQEIARMLAGELGIFGNDNFKDSPDVGVKKWWK